MGGQWRDWGRKRENKRTYIIGDGIAKRSWSASCCCSSAKKSPRGIDFLVSAKDKSA
jgi:hypothetical protein